MNNKLTISYRDGKKITIELEEDIDKILKSLQNCVNKEYSNTMKFLLDKEDEELFHRERTGIEIELEKND